jgi:Skp family chaperone for outer membrane proteins
MKNNSAMGQSLAADWAKQQKEIDDAVGTSFKTVADQNNEARKSSQALSDALAKTDAAEQKQAQEEQKHAQEVTREWTRARD